MYQLEWRIIEIKLYEFIIGRLKAFGELSEVMTVELVWIVIERSFNFED